MGVNAPYVEHVIHITPPINIESYDQETGHAGRTGIPSQATLFYNNSDIAANKKHVQETMKAYCRSEDTCLRKLIVEYLGFSCVNQQRCCCICHETVSKVAVTIPKSVQPKVRKLPTGNKSIHIFNELEVFENNMKASGMVLFDCSFSEASKKKADLKTEVKALHSSQPDDPQQQQQRDSNHFSNHSLSSNHSATRTCCKSCNNSCSMANAFRLAGCPRSTLQDFVAIAELKIVNPRECDLVICVS